MENEIALNAIREHRSAMFKIIYNVNKKPNLTTILRNHDKSRLYISLIYTDIKSGLLTCYFETLFIPSFMMWGEQ